MRKLFTFVCVLLLWQSIAVAQNFLHISKGDTTLVVPMAELDSVTIRSESFYAPRYLCDGVYQYSFFSAPLDTVPIYVSKNSVIAKGVFYGKDLVINVDFSNGSCSVPQQQTGYTHSDYGIVSVYGIGTFDFLSGLFELQLTYIVDAGSWGTFFETLQLDMGTYAGTPCMRRVEDEKHEKNQASRRLLVSPKQSEGVECNNTMELIPVSTREYIK